MDQLDIIALVVRDENIESAFVRDLKIVELLISSGLQITLVPDIITRIESLPSQEQKNATV